MNGVTSSMRWVPCSVAAITVLCGCGGGGFDTSQYPTPETLMPAAVEAFERGDCGRAEVGFERLAFELSARDPRQAEVRYYLAECRFRDGQYLEATRDYRRLSNNFPQHPLAPRALLRAGEAYARLWRRPELDPTYGESARTTLLELLNRYPQSEAAQQANALIAQLNEKFAIKEYKGGEYYMRFKAYDSAIIYYKAVVANYAASSYAPRAVIRLIEAYDRIGYEEEKQEMCQYLVQYHPDVERGGLPCPDTASR